MRRTRKEELDPNSLVQRHKIFIPTKHLNPVLNHGVHLLSFIRTAKLSVVAAAAFYKRINPLDVLSLHIGTMSVRQLHDDFMEAMNKYGVLNTARERNYPRGWMNPATIMRTHPIFFLTPRGITFVRESKMEYMRYRTQRSIIGKAGLNPWFWRAYLRPPTAPKAWQKEAKTRIEQLQGPVPHAVEKSRVHMGLLKKKHEILSRFLKRRPGIARR